MEGGILSAPKHTASITVEVAASAETLYQTLTDLNASNFVSTIVSQEIVKGAKAGVGMVLKEVKEFGGNDTVIYKTITSTSENPRSVSASIHQNLERGPKDGVRTGSWTIQPIDAENSVIVWTFAAVREDFFGSVSYFFFGRCIVEKTKTYFEKELCEYAAEAERRQVTEQYS